MDLYLNILQALPAFAELKSALKTGAAPALLLGLSGVLSSHFIYGISREFDESVLVVCPDEGVAKRLCDDFNAMAGFELGGVFPAKEISFRSSQTTSKEYELQRLHILTKIIRGELKVVFAGAEALMQFTIPPDQLKARSTVISAGQSISVADLTAVLSAAGYTRRDMVDGVSQFAVRGGIVDFYPAGTDFPVRVEFWGDTVDTIANFDVLSQRRGEALTQISVSPANEVLFDSPEALGEKLTAFLDGHTGGKNTAPYERIRQDIETVNDNFELGSCDRYYSLAYEKPATLFDYLPGAITVVSEYSDIIERVRGFTKMHHEDIKQLLEEGLVCPELSVFIQDEETLLSRIISRKTVCIGAFARSYPEVKPRTIISVTAAQNTGWGGDIKPLSEDLDALTGTGHTCVVLVGTKKTVDTLVYDLHTNNISAIDGYKLTQDKLIPGNAYVFEGTLSGGFEYPELKFNLITQSVRTTLVKRRYKPKAREMINNLSDLSPGDYVVHISHGIGIFDGIHKLELDGVVKDYIKIRYQGADTLYVPVIQLDLISKYIGPKEGSGVKLNKLNSTAWQTTRSRVKKAVADMADELIKLYAARAQIKGYTFSPDNDWQRQFEQRFEYEETDDQLRCIDEIKDSMQKSSPMDRLLCGDVGYGKTEVALRAAFKCVLDSKQCVILCPTTILAWQHYQTVTRRIGNFPVNIELLSRFRTPKQQKEIVKKLADGQIDIIIGTHRLVQKDVKFKDLGLAVIDEEQRFGVAHKEAFKQAFLGVDVLSLSATPIPRTLNMAMSGVRDMSVLEEPPQDRFPIQTYVIEHDMPMICDAIRRELRRGGQVYYIHNRVDTIESAAFRISEQIPDARIGIAHGQMKEDQLSEIWQQLIEQKIDVLVCTTIIETGVDVANCNTLIIEDADRLGLSQLYQLRGRVGRSSRRAFAYFTFTRGKQLTEIAEKRLTAIREFTKFGSGFRIAMRDLEIRGAGNILGAKQHGHMEAVGYDMYVRLLSEAVSEKQGTAVPAKTECLIDLQIDAHIPEDYISNLSQRLEIYRRIAGVKDDEEASDVIDELIDRYGDPPDGVKGLIDIAMLRYSASVLGITEVSARNRSLLLFTEELDMELAGKIMSALKGRVMVNAGNKPHISVRFDKGQTALDVLRQVLSCC